MAVLRSAPSRWLIKVMESMLLPGVQLHYALRKACIEGLVRTALVDGFDRIWVVAAGFDWLAPRLHTEFPSVQFVEIDHPATQKVKRDVCLRTLTMGSNLAFVAADLKGQPLSVVVDSVDLTRNHGNVFVFEGIAMYLTEEEVCAIFRDIVRISGARTRVVFTFMNVERAGAIRFSNASGLIDLWLGFRHEPFAWGIAASALPGFLEALGFRCLKVFDADELRREHLTAEHLNVTLAEGECICLAERQ
jgi:methyltransferase (TIGR00027 family)